MNIKVMLSHCSSPRMTYKENVCLLVLLVLPGVLLVQSAKCNYVSRTRDYCIAKPEASLLPENMSKIPL